MFLGPLKKMAAAAAGHNNRVPRNILGLFKVGSAYYVHQWAYRKSPRLTKKKKKIER